jgi:hypothetical protein
MIDNKTRSWLIKRHWDHEGNCCLVPTSSFWKTENDVRIAAHVTSFHTKVSGETAVLVRYTNLHIHGISHQNTSPYFKSSDTSIVMSAPINLLYTLGMSPSTKLIIIAMRGITRC